MTAEHEARLNDITNGPWRGGSELARRQLPKFAENELARLLRFHIPGGIEDADEIKFRDSFDQVLEELQLLELAVACGFLPLDAVRAAAEFNFVRMLSSAAAREYVRVYDFIAVRYLASRLSIDLGTDPVNAPPVDPNAEVRYAAFLGTHYEFSANVAIVQFTRFIDDFWYGQREINAAFLKAWAGGERPADLSSPDLKRLRRGYLGFVQFVETLGDLFLQLRREEWPYFGLAYSYWLSHFFGLRRDGGGYRKKATSFEDAHFDSDSAEESARFKDRVATLKAVWAATEALIVRG